MEKYDVNNYPPSKYETEYYKLYEDYVGAQVLHWGSMCTRWQDECN